MKKVIAIWGLVCAVFLAVFLAVAIGVIGMPDRMPLSVTALVTGSAMLCFTEALDGLVKDSPVRKGVVYSLKASFVLILFAVIAMLGY